MNRVVLRAKKMGTLKKFLKIPIQCSGDGTIV